MQKKSNKGYSQAIDMPSDLDRVKGIPPLKMEEDYNNDDLADFEVDNVLGDTLLVEYADGDASEKTVGGIIIQSNISTKMWRVGRVLMAGDKTSYVKNGEYIIFPYNNPQIARVANLRVNKKPYKELLFVKEDIVFCKCHPVDK